jgi:hypothetical protein
MSAFLTWSEAKTEAAAGKLIRREDWPLPGSDRAWLRKRAVLWESLDKRLQSLGIVEAGEFTSAEFFAKDWTTDELGTVRDVCQRASRPLYAPPGIRLTGVLGTDLTLHLDLGDSAPRGAYWVTFLVNGVEVATVEAATPGRYTQAAVMGGEIYAEARVRSISPLPEWESVAVWRQASSVPTFFAGTVTGSRAQFVFGSAVDSVRGFAYSIQSKVNESGWVARINLNTGRIDTLPIKASYGCYLRESDGSLFCQDNRTGDSVLRSYLPHLWSPGDALPPVTTGSAVHYYTEHGVYSPDLDAVLLPKTGEILRYPAATLTSPTQHVATAPSYGVHGMRWEDGKVWWVEGDQSYGGRWAVGSTVFNTSPAGFMSDMVPFPDLGRAILVGHPWTVQSIYVVNTTTGAVIYTISGHAQPGIGGCVRKGDSAVVFDVSNDFIRTVDVLTGAYVDTPTPVAAPYYATGFNFPGTSQVIALPHDADWSDDNCGILVL